MRTEEKSAVCDEAKCGSGPVESTKSTGDPMQALHIKYLKKPTFCAASPMHKIDYRTPKSWRNYSVSALTNSIKAFHPPAWRATGYHYQNSYFIHSYFIHGRTEQC
jgi:hypothetical protein